MNGSRAQQSKKITDLNFCARVTPRNYFGKKWNDDGSLSEGYIESVKDCVENINKVILPAFGAAIWIEFEEANYSKGENNE